MAIGLLLTVGFGACQSDSSDQEEKESNPQPEPQKEEYVELVDDQLIDFSVQGIDNGEAAEISELETTVTELPDESTSKVMYFESEEDSLAFDQLAQEVLQLNIAKSKSAISKASEDVLAEEVIRQGENINIFSNTHEIEQIVWDCGSWDNSHWGNFNCYFNTTVRNGSRWLIVVLYKKEGFVQSGTAYLKLAAVNTGKVLVERHIDAGSQYVILPYKIDLDAPGCLNIFPLVIAKNKYRSYLNPIMIKYKPIIVNNWQSLGYGDLFGTIDGVGVYCNGSSNMGSGTYQCVELCKRYLKTLYPGIKRKLYNDLWGNANEWPDARRNDSKDPNKYLVLENNGENQVHEGDILVFQHAPYGHVAVVIKNAPNYISIAHQNGSFGKYAVAIGTKLAKQGDYVTNYHPDTKKSPIFSGSNYISHFIRFVNDNTQSQSVDDKIESLTISCGLVREVVSGDANADVISVSTNMECKIYLFINGEVEDHKTGVSQYTFHPSNLSPGIYKIQFKAYNGNEFVETTEFQCKVLTPIIIDPLTITCTPVTSATRGTTANVSATASKPGKITMYVDDQAYTSVRNQTTMTYDLSQLPVGSHKIKFKVNDGSEYAETREFQCTIENPEFNVTLAAYVGSRTVSEVEYGTLVVFNATSNRDCLMDLYIDGELVHRGNSESPANVSQKLYSTDKLSPGSHTIKVYATERYDNCSYQTTIEVKAKHIDNPISDDGNASIPDMGNEDL